MSPKRIRMTLNDRRQREHNGPAVAGRQRPYEREVVQIVGMGGRLHALCDDGSIWIWTLSDDGRMEAGWYEHKPVPGSRRECLLTDERELEEGRDA